MYKSQVNRLTDIVRSSVECSSFAAANAVVEVRCRLVVLFDVECRVKDLLCCCWRLMLRLQILLSVGFVRPLERSASANNLVERCIRMSPWAVAQQLPMVESDSQPMLKNTDTPTSDITSQTSGKILEILRVRNRFVEGSAHSSGGFRDLAFKVKLGYQVLAVDAVSSSACRTVSAIQCCACRSLRAERLSLCQCMRSCLHTAAMCSL